jgi:hypothetical protein
MPDLGTELTTAVRGRLFPDPPVIGNAHGGHRGIRGSSRPARPVSTAARCFVRTGPASRTTGRVSLRRSSASGMATGTARGVGSGPAETGPPTRLAPTAASSRGAPRSDGAPGPTSSISSKSSSCGERVSATRLAPTAASSRGAPRSDGAPGPTSPISSKSSSCGERVSETRGFRANATAEREVPPAPVNRDVRGPSHGTRGATSSALRTGASAAPWERTSDRIGWAWSVGPAAIRSPASSSSWRSAVRGSGAAATSCGTCRARGRSCLAFHRWLVDLPIAAGRAWSRCARDRTAPARRARPRFPSRYAGCVAWSRRGGARVPHHCHSAPRDLADSGSNRHASA